MTRFNTKWMPAIVALVALALGSTARAVTLADLAADYQDGLAGQTSNDVPITGSTIGTWHYYSDTNANPIDGGRVLLTFQPVGLEPGATGFAGTGTVFGNCCGPFPIISENGLFDGVVAPPAGSLATHPGSSSSTPPEFLSIEYRAPGTNQVLRNVTLDYRIQLPNGGSDGVDSRILDTRGRNIAIASPPPTATITIANLPIPTLRPGESYWVALGNGPADNPGGDQTFLRMVVNGDVANLIADLATDYRDGSAGQTSTDVGITGTTSGRWTYYSDSDNNPLNGGLTLLTFKNVGLEGGDGFAGTGTVFNNCCGPFPIISDDGLFDGITVPPPGSLAAHPGGSGGSNVPPEYLVIEFEATDRLTNLVLTYEVENPGTPGDGIDWRILDNAGAVLAMGTLNGMTTGLIDLAAPDVDPGEHLFFVLGNGAGDNPGTDQTFISLTLSGDVVIPVPEPASAAMGVLAIGGLVLRRRRHSLRM